jgi:FkbM family methyltransferase
MLWRALGHIPNGFYIDVGANDPTLDSTTRLFYENGWNGINLEPSRQWFLRLQEERVRDVNLELGAGATNGVMEFFEFPNTGLSTLDADVAKMHEASGKFDQFVRTIEVRQLAEICDEHAESEIHFLKIDVEGAERDVLRGMDFSRYRPWIVVVESTLPLQTKENYSGWESILLKTNYKFVYFDGLNRFYVAKEKFRELGGKFATPPNVFDDFETHAVARLREENSLLIAAATSERWHEPRETDAREGIGNTLPEQDPASAPMHKSHSTDPNSPSGPAMESTDVNRDHEALIQELQEKLNKAEQRVRFSEKNAKINSIRAVNAELELEKQVNTVRKLVVARDQQHNVNKLLAAELTAFTHSVSWKLTAPVRWASRPLYWLIDEQLASSDTLVQWLINTTGFRSLTAALARLSPNLQRTIDAQHHPKAGGGAGKPPRIKTGPIYFNSTPLSPRAVRIYEELRDAVASRRTDQT